MTFDELTQYLGRFVFYGGVSVSIFWVVTQKTAERWVEAHFAKRQKAFEHEQAKELQRIKAKLDTVIQGSLKLQEREFQEIDTRMRYSKVHAALSAADNFLKVNSIFLPDELREQFTKQIHNIWEALISFEVGNFPGPRDYKTIREAWAQLKRDGEPLHAEIEKAVRKRLLEQTQLADEWLHALK